jgi:hypothetical protein
MCLVWHDLALSWSRPSLSLLLSLLSDFGLASLAPPLSLSPPPLPPSLSRLFLLNTNVHPYPPALPLQPHPPHRHRVRARTHIHTHAQFGSPLTTHISGCSKTALQTLLGILIFKNKVSALNIAGPPRNLPLSLTLCHPQLPVTLAPPPASEPVNATLLYSFPPSSSYPVTRSLRHCRAHFMSLCHTPEPKILDRTHEHARTQADTFPAPIPAPTPASWLCDGWCQALHSPSWAPLFTPSRNTCPRSSSENKCFSHLTGMRFLLDALSFPRRASTASGLAVRLANFITSINSK